MWAQVVGVAQQGLWAWEGSDGEGGRGVCWWEYAYIAPLPLFHPVNKQLADKERVAAALENTHLLEVVNQCLSARS